MMAPETAEALRLLAMASAAVATGKLDARRVIGALASVLDLGPGSQLPLLPAEAVAARVSEKGDDNAAVKRIFARWQRTLDHPHARLTPDRVRAVKARLREGYTEAQINAAIDGCAASPFHVGENEQGTRYDDLTLICRSGSKLESFAARAPDGAPPPQTADQERAEAVVREIQDEMREARKAGDRDRYEAANRRLAAALRRAP